MTSYLWPCVQPPATIGKTYQACFGKYMQCIYQNIVDKFFKSCDLQLQGEVGLDSYISYFHSTKNLKEKLCIIIVSVEMVITVKYPAPLSSFFH